ncbi:hypothetical protein [Pontixanthobacter sp.]|uniref:hypothetical protein n=1 Tax=Pontixanthobacter sp. TaxID=2792078 RepID=UPI003C7C3C19
MIKNIIAGIAGKKLAGTTNSIGGPAGAALGIVSMAVLRRASIPAMVAIAAGGYAWKKYSEKQEGAAPPATNPPATNPPAKNPPKVKATAM